MGIGPGRLIRWALVCAVALAAASCFSDFPGFAISFTNASHADVLVRFENVAGVRVGQGYPAEDETFLISAGAREVGPRWVDMDWSSGGLLNPRPDAIAIVRIFTPTCEPIADFEIHKGDSPQVLITSSGEATMTQVDRLEAHDEVHFVAAIGRCP